MAIANVTIDHTFDEWRTTTNQLIVQSGQAFDVAVASFNASNTVVGTAANLTANLIIANTAYTNTIVNTIIVQETGNIANLVLANTEITNTIYQNANTIAEGYFADALLVFPQANTARDHANASYGQANTSRNHANAAFIKANAALANTDSYTLVISNLVITGNLTLSGSDAVLNML